MLLIDVIVAKSCVGDSRVTSKVMTAIDFQPDEQSLLLCTSQGSDTNDGREHIAQIHTQSVLSTHTQLNYFYLTSIPGIMCMTSHLEWDVCWWMSLYGNTCMSHRHCAVPLLFTMSCKHNTDWLWWLWRWWRPSHLKGLVDHKPNLN